MFPKPRTYCQPCRANIQLQAEYVIRMSGLSNISSMIELWNDGVRSGV